MCATALGAKMRGAEFTMLAGESCRVFLARPLPIGLPHKGPSPVVRSSRSVEAIFFCISESKEMNLFLIRFWFSRFGGFNSRLGSLNSRLSLLREFIGNALILLTVFGNKTALLQRKSKNSLFNGNNREFGPRRRQWRAAGLVDT